MSLSDADAADEGERRQPIAMLEFEETPEEFIHHRDIAGNGRLRETVVEQTRRPTIQELMSQERRRLIRCGKLAN